MGMIFRPGQRLVIPGVQVLSPRPAAAATASDGWWNNNGAISGCVAAYAPKGAADLASSYINLANPGTYNAAPGVAPTHSSADGWTFNGTSQYLNTNIIVNSGTYSLMVRFSNVVGAGSLCGFYVSSTVQLRLVIDVSVVNVVLYANGGQLNTSPALTSGVLGVAGRQGYRNGSADGGTIGGWSGTNTEPIFIGARKQGGAATAFIPAKIQALAIYSSTLTAGEVATLTTLINAL